MVSEGVGVEELIRILILFVHLKWTFACLFLFCSTLECLIIVERSRHNGGNVRVFRGEIWEIPNMSARGECCEGT